MNLKCNNWLLITCLLLFAACGSGDDDDDNTNPDGIDYRKEMRDFVIGISSYSKDIQPGFLVLPQNGENVISTDDDPTMLNAQEYFQAIDGLGREDLFYGYDDDNKATPEDVIAEILPFLTIYEDNGVEVLVTDYASSDDKMADSYEQNEVLGFASFAADRRDLDNIPDYPSSPNNENSDDINSLSDVRNFLYILDPENENNFSSRQNFINQIAATNYDLLIIDAFYDGSVLTYNELSTFKTKANGGTRLIIGYMSIGEAGDFRYYWQPSRENDPPEWVEAENKNFPGNFKLRYWEQEWQDIIFGNDGSYLKMILDAQFDGVYLDIIDAFEFFE